MDLFTYLLGKKGQNTHKDLFSYLLGKNAGGSGTYTTFSGTSLNISNTIKAAIKKFMLNSTELTQDGTPTPDNPVDVNVITGSNNVKVENKNLFDFDNVDITRLGNEGNVSISDNEIVFTATGQEVFGVIIDLAGLNLKNNTTYTVSNLMDNTDSNVRPLGWRYYNGSSYTALNYYQTEFTFTTSNSGINRLLYYVGSPANYNGMLTLSNMQLEEGNTATEYVEHQEQNYPISLSSKNLLNVPSNFNFKATYFIDMELETGNYILSWSSVFTDSTNTKANVIMRYEDNTTSGNNFVNFNSTSRFLNPTKKVNRIYFYSDVGAASSADITITYENLMLEQGSTATKYEPYIANPIEYCKIGDYADQFFKNTKDSEFYDNTLLENEWYLKKNIGKVTFDGSEFTLVSNYNNLNYASVLKPMDFIGRGDYMLYKIVCSKAISQSVELTGWDSANMIGKLTTEPSKYNMWIGVPKTVTLEEIQETLNSTIAYYPLATPTYIHISETDYPILRSQLENLYNNAKSYNGQTNITQTNDDLPFNISVDVKVANL